MNDEQSAVADGGKGFALVAITARKQLSALQTAFLKSSPGAAQLETASSEGTRNRLERILKCLRVQDIEIEKQVQRKEKEHDKKGLSNIYNSRSTSIAKKPFGVSAAQGHIT